MTKPGNFPEFARNLNTGGCIVDETEMRVAQQTVFHCAEYPLAHYSSRYLEKPKMPTNSS